MALPDQAGTPADRGPNQPASALDLHSGAQVGDYLAVPDPEGHIEIEDAPDGGAFVSMPGQRLESTPPDEEFYGNLAAVLPNLEKARISTELLRLIEEDKEARKKRDEQYEEGIRRTGLGKDAPGGAEFEGASRVVHPMLTEACIDYWSRVVKELFPPNAKPVKPRILGVPTKDKEAQAQRVTDHMSWQLRTQIKEARAVLDVTLTQVPLGGSQFIRLHWDHRLTRPRMQFASIDKVLIPFNAADFASAHRKTYVEMISGTELQLRVDSGMYIDAGLASPGILPEQTRAEKASKKVEGAEDPGTNPDGDRELFEVQVLLEATDGMCEFLNREQPGQLYPYLITIDGTSREMLAMYRDWEDGDAAHEAIDHLFEFPFLPWRGAYSIGFPQLIGGLSAAATGAMRALLDSALINNSAGGLILKGSGSSGSTPRPVVGEMTEIDAGLEADDIRKRVMPFPSNQPSSVLFQLLGFVVEAGQGVVRTSMDETPAQGLTPTPVGTQMSRIEEGLANFSAVHGRAHAAFDRFLAGLHRLNRLYLPEVLKVDADGQEIMVRRSDYDGPCSVQPVSDPTIYSDQQRFAQLNYLHTRAAAVPALWDLREVELQGLKLIKWPNPESLLITPPKATEMNAVSENVSMALGRPVAVFPMQDHMAHLRVLADFLQSPVLGSNPAIAPVFLPAAIKHAAEHVVELYAQTMMEVVRKANEGRDPGSLLSDDDGVKAAFDQLLATASGQAVQSVTQALLPAAPILEKAMQLLHQVAPKPPPDPALAAVEAAANETSRKAAADTAQEALGRLKIAAALEGQRLAAGSRIAVAEIGQKGSGTIDPVAAAEAGMDGPPPEEQSAAAPPTAPTAAPMGAAPGAPGQAPAEGAPSPQPQPEEPPQ